jgi:hypothetical protein
MKKQEHAIGRWTRVAACVFAMLCGAAAQERTITLQDAINIATRANHGLKAASYQVEAEEQNRRIAKSGYFPSVTNESFALHITDVQRVDVPAGAFGPTIPATNVFLTQGRTTFSSRFMRIIKSQPQI